jgi:hypothetical protein
MSDAIHLSTQRTKYARIVEKLIDHDNEAQPERLIADVQEAVRLYREIILIWLVNRNATGNDFLLKEDPELVLSWARHIGISANQQAEHRGEALKTAAEHASDQYYAGLARASRAIIEAENASDGDRVVDIDEAELRQLQAHFVHPLRMVESEIERLGAGQGAEPQPKDLTEKSAGSESELIERPTRPVTKAYAAHHWFKTTPKTLRQWINDGKVRCQELSRQRTVFDLDAVVAIDGENDEDADPSIYGKSDVQ